MLMHGRDPASGQRTLAGACCAFAQVVGERSKERKTKHRGA
jgi:hypothetical protein